MMNNPVPFFFYRKHLQLNAFLFIIILTAGSCNTNSPKEGIKVVDTKPNLVKVGNLLWATKNLDIHTFRNGDTIPEAKTDEQWISAGDSGKPAWCYYNNDPKNGKIYGKLYNWYAVNDKRGLAPENWRLPSTNDWHLLTPSPSKNNIPGKKNLTTQDVDPDEVAIEVTGKGSKEFGFSKMHGVCRNKDGGFIYSDNDPCWWSNTDYDLLYAYNYHRWFDSEMASEFFRHKSFGLPVRCLKD